MKNNINMKKVIAALAAAGILMSGAAVFADEAAPDTEIVSSTASLYNGGSAIVHVVTVDGHKTVPVRQVMEALNFTVSWDEEAQQVRCNRGAVEIGFIIGQDGYTLAKTAPMPLGVAPYLYNDETTYVPVELFTDILWFSAYDDTDEYVIVAEPAVVTFKSFESDEYGDYIVVEDSLRGEVIVRISEDTILNNGQGINTDELVEGQTLKINYGVAMTMSLPPQTTALSIETVEIAE